MKNAKNSFVILLFILSAVILLLGFYANSNKVLSEKKIPAKLEIGDKVGFDTNISILSFGIIKEGSVSNRELIIGNEYDFPIKAEFSAEGDIARFLVFEESTEIGVGESKKVPINTINPANEEFGNYSGNLVVRIFRK